MPDLSDTGIADLATTTLGELGPPRFSQIAQDLQNYECMGKILKKDKVQFDGGKQIERRIMHTTSGAARMVGLHETDNVNIADTLATLTVPWRHTTTFMAWERREILENKGKAKIVSLMESKRADMMISLADLMEDEFWSKPDDSNDKLELFGVPYWIVKNSSTGFNGGDPSGFTSGAGGLDTATYPNWKNYTAQYAAVTKADLIKKMRTAYRKIQFKSPVNINDLSLGNGANYRIYVNESLMADLEDLGEAQNENLGRDIASIDGGTITFRKNPIIWVPKLDEDTENPIYMIDWNKFRPFVLDGDYLRETDPEKAANQHNTWVVYVDLTWNVLCIDRRRQAVLYL